MIDLTRAFSGMNVESATRVTWTLPGSLPYFDGHFPGNPIFPAVGIVDASLHALARIVGRNVELEAIPNAKFTLPIGPDQPVALSFNPTGDHGWTVEWTLVEGHRAVAALTLNLRADA